MDFPGYTIDKEMKIMINEKRDSLRRKNKLFMILASILVACIVADHAYASGIDAQVVSSGEYSQVSTIVGTGTAGQGTYTTDHPRFPVASGKRVYFLDGDTQNTKLRYWDGKRNTTLVDMSTNKVTRREADFFTSGLAVTNGVVYFASKDHAYKVIGDRVTEMTNVVKWMKSHGYYYIYRMEKYQDDLVFMMWSKSSGGTYGFAHYDLQSGTVSELLEPTFLGNPTNFEALPDGILVATEGGQIYYEKYFPRQSMTFVDTNEGQILDAWIDEDKTLYYSIAKDKLKPVIRSVPNHTHRTNENDVVAGSVSGYVDGIGDEVEMHDPTNFSWDGSGYIFADKENNTIRKLWIDRKPYSLVH
jgi:hypothetical protein